MILRVILLSICGFVSAQNRPPPDPPAAMCSIPKVQTVEKIEDAGLTGRYPKSQMNRAILETTELRKSYNTARKDICDCYRPKLPIPPIGAANASSSVGDKGPIGRPVSFYVDTCPPVQNIFVFPTSEIYKGMQCWIYRPWAKLRCPFVDCRYKSCQGVKASPFGAYCVPTNLKCKTYFIWCPKTGKSYKRKRCFPKCCSCKYLKCFWPTVGK